MNRRQRKAFVRDQQERDRKGPMAVKYDAVVRALGVIVLTRGIREHLRSHDPKALQQAVVALDAIGFEATDRIAALDRDEDTTHTTKGT